MNRKIAIVVGASGGIGLAIVRRLLKEDVFDVVAISRSEQPADLNVAEKQLSWLQTDHSDAWIERYIKDHPDSWLGRVSKVIVVTGMLHQQGVKPEKRWEEIDEQQLQEYFRINAILPMRWLKEFCTAFEREQDCTLAVLSARIGSIEDNRLGGWYGYRASKAALNMMLKTMAIEANRKKSGLTFLAIHPGTTDTALSEPFQGNVPSEKLFTPEYVANSILILMNETYDGPNVRFTDWQGANIPW